MFDGIRESLDGFFSKIRGKGNKLTEQDVKDGLRTVRMALLEADVALPVVKEFMTGVSEKAVGSDVLTAVEPSQQIVKIVHDELIRLMGPGNAEIQQSGCPPKRLKCYKL